MESEMKVGSREHRSEFFGVSVADALEEEALLQRFVQLKSELEEHQEVRGPWKFRVLQGQGVSPSLFLRLEIEAAG